MTGERLRRGLWWLLVVLTLGAYAFALPTAGSLQNATLVVPMAGYLVVGAIITRRRPDNAIGWVFLATAAASGILGASNVLYTRTVDSLLVDPPPPGTIPEIGGPALVSIWVSSWLWFVLLYLMTFLTFLLFPDGLPSRRWRPLLWLGSGSLALVTLLVMIWPTFDLRGSDPLSPTFTIPNPFSRGLGELLAPELEDKLESLFAVVALTCLVLSVISLLVRFRRATVTERAQLRWFALSATALLLSLPVQEALPGGSDGTVANLLFTVVATFVPVSCGVAILRYRLYDIDRVISRTVSYAIVTGLALATFVVIVTSATRLLPEGSSPLVVAAATLAAAALVRPLLRRVQRVVDRRFNRSRYDAERTVEQFGERLRYEVQGPDVQEALLVVVRRAVDPAVSALWVSGRPTGTP